MKSLAFGAFALLAQQTAHGGAGVKPPNGMLKNAMAELHLSARAYDRILKVARTVADRENPEQIRPEHLREAIGYRTVDRNLWA